MKLYFSCLGLISFILLGALAKESVTVTRDIVTKASPDVIMAPEDKVNITLNCTGSRSKLSFYVRNRVKWDFINVNGDKLAVTEAFYKAPKSAYAEENFNSGHFSFRYGPDDTTGNFVFELSIFGVTRADDGIYKCTLHGEGDTVIDSKELKVTVVNPVQTVSIELHDTQNNLISKSSSPARQDGATVQITPGKYKVKCVATGSNPEPVMNLFLNQQTPYVAINTKRVEGTQFREYEGSFEVQSLTINAQNSPQLLTCTANIPNGDKNAEAGLTLMVRIETPSVECMNATAALGDRNTKIICKVSAEGNNDALICDNISWQLGVKGQTIAYDQRWKDPSQEYDIIEAKCVKAADGLTAMLDLQTVSESMFKETYFLVYGKDVTAHRYPVTLYDITTAAAGVVTPLSLLACLVMAVLSKYLAHLSHQSS